MTITEADHGISVVTVQLPAGNPLRAECLCGWQSPIVGSRPQAIADGQAHIEGGDVLAAAVGARMRERGVRLNADDLSVVAMALDCTEAEIRGYTVEWDAEAVRLTRPAWMTDHAQWMRLRAQADAYFESEGILRDEVTR